MGEILNYNYQLKVNEKVYGTKRLSGVLVKLSEESLMQIDNFARQVIKRKVEEQHHQRDNRNEYRRFSNGIKGERAVEVLLDKLFIDWTIGDSRVYNISDLNSLGLNVGVKTVELGKAPIISKNPREAQIMVILLEDRYALICGLASLELLKDTRYHNDALILSPKLRERNVKTGFKGLEHVSLFKNYEELQHLSQ